MPFSRLPDAIRRVPDAIPRISDAISLLPEHKIGVFVRFCLLGPLFSSVLSTK